SGATGIFGRQNRSRQSEGDSNSRRGVPDHWDHPTREHMTAQTSEASRAELEPVSDAHLVALAQGGDEAAFQALFEAHKRRVYSICLRMTHSPADADDLTQEAFLQVFRKIGAFRGESTFSTWLYRLAVNGVLMHLRKKRSQEGPLNEGETSHEESLAHEYAQNDLQLTGTVDRLTLN